MHYFLINFGIFLLFINVIVWATQFLKQGKTYRIFTIYLIVIFCIQLISNIMMRHSINNIYLSHLYFGSQFILLSLFYHSIFKQELHRSTLKIGLVAGLLILVIQFSLDFSLFYKFNLLEILLTSLLLIVFATIHFYNLLNEKKEFYYINIGLLMYLFGSTILFLLGNVTALLSSKWNLLVWTLNALIYVVFQFFILLEWMKSFSKKKSAKIFL
jgi:hypothetical protein